MMITANDLEELLHSLKYFGLRLSHLVFAITEEVSLFLQSKTVILQDAVGHVTVARRCFKRQSTGDAYSLFIKMIQTP